MTPRLLFLTCLLLGVVLLPGCDSGGMDDDPDPDLDIVGTVNLSINTTADRAPISPYIYGSNQDRGSGDRWTVRRLGGNRLTGYNWENNFSNAGSDYQHSSDLFLITNAGLPTARASEPGLVATHFHDQSLQQNAESIITLQMAGYVSRDGNGSVTEGQTAPSSRWVPVVPRKEAPFVTTPDLTDDAVYMDEFVHFLVQRYGNAAAADGVRWYSLDNEPALWFHTHVRIHPEPTGATELVDRTIAWAAAVKDVDPNAEILGPALYGFGAYGWLQEAPDWNQVRAGHDWFIDYYLDELRRAEATEGQRLLDVLDVHWYPEARGDNRITDPASTTPADIEARLQAPRTLWDPTYTESSWIAECCSAFLPILPRLQQSIAQNYPGTRLAITEYDYGGGGHISGGLAQADVLGAYGKYGVYLATLWGIDEADSYQSAAFSLYRNYDGQNSTFGNTSVRATTSDKDATSVYAAIEDGDAATLHLIVLAKNQEGALELNFDVESDTPYTSGEVWAFDEAGSAIRRLDAIDGITGNAFRYVLPGNTAAHFVLR